MRIKAITAALLCAVTAHAKGDNGPMKLVPVENVKVPMRFGHQDTTTGSR